VVSHDSGWKVSCSFSAITKQLNDHSSTLSEHHSADSVARNPLLSIQQPRKTREIHVSVTDNSTNYLAISHVWGEAEWRVLSVLDGEKILASKEKARFIEDGLREFTGEEYFWMDVLCVDQGNADARVAITQHIPAIFRRAQKTIVIRDGYVFRNVALTPWVPPAY
jgi:Heterokaryon incompatibility protein (HET)